MSQSVRLQVEEILKKTETEVDKAPDTTHLLSKIKSDMVQEHALSKQITYSRKSIPEKYHQLIVVAPLPGTGVPSCILTWSGSLCLQAARPGKGTVTG
ncbi:MAG: hypothetical protein K6T91_10025 [Firmicutes bacterium]|nr:hypothetical protein [Bacillota bacterium]